MAGSSTVDWLTASRPLIIGHRGASADAPENTLAAFALAADQGADGIELDVRLSADGWPVVVHDASVDRTTNGEGLVSRLTVDQLHALDAGAGQHVPTLDEVFEWLGPRVLYNVDLKNFNVWGDVLETAVSDRIESHNLQGRVLVSSFNPFSLRHARRHLTRRTPLGLIRHHRWLKVGHRLCTVQADHPHYSLVDENYMAWATAQKLRVHVWTVDDPLEAERLVRLGVHGIATNKPGVIRQHLE